MPNFRTRNSEPRPTGSVGLAILYYGFLSLFPLAGLGVVAEGLRQLWRGRDVGWFLLGFGALWLGLCALMAWAWRRTVTPTEVDGAGSDDPEIRASGAGMSIPGSAALGAPGAWIAGLVFAGPGLLLFHHSLVTPAMQGRNIGIGMGAGFSLLGLLLVFSLAVRSLHRRKFGLATLRLPDSAGNVGAPFDGVIQIPSGIRGGERFRVRLSCVRVTAVLRNSDEPSAERRETLWVGEQHLRAPAPEPEGTLELPFAIRIPEGLPGSSADQPSIHWHVDIVAALPGLDFRERFEVPVAWDGPDLPNHRLERESRQAPWSPRPDWTADRIEVDRRVGPLWPGMPGIGLVAPRLAEWISSTPDAAYRMNRVASFLGILAMLAVVAGWFGWDSGQTFLVRIPRAYSFLQNTLAGLALGCGGLYGLAAGLRAWHQAWHLKQFGISFLRLSSLPVPPGTIMRGVLDIPRRIAPETAFSFRLLFVRTRWFSRAVPGPAAAASWTGDWNAFAGHDPGNDQTEVPFELPVPRGQPESGSGGGASQWYVEVKAPVPGLDYIARFRVPVGRP